LKLQTSEIIAVTEQHSFKSCGIAIAEVLPSSCGIKIADSQKKLRVPTSANFPAGKSFGAELSVSKHFFLQNSIVYSPTTVHLTIQ
jgi:hypothetical protein